MSILENVNDIAALRALPEEQLPALCSEIRAFLIENVSKTGGHLASNLGTVELTVALDRVYDPFRDRIVFDVGHQCYTHKLLTGRREGFAGLRQYGGISGFPKPSESRADAFIEATLLTASPLRWAWPARARAWGRIMTWSPS